MVGFSGQYASVNLRLLEIRVAEPIPQDRQRLTVQDSITGKGVAQGVRVNLDGGGRFGGQLREALVGLVFVSI